MSTSSPINGTQSSILVLPAIWLNEFGNTKTSAFPASPVNTTSVNSFTLRYLKTFKQQSIEKNSSRVVPDKRKSLSSKAKTPNGRISMNTYCNNQRLLRFARNDGVCTPPARHCEERQRRSNPVINQRLLRFARNDGVCTPPARHCEERH